MGVFFIEIWLTGRQAKRHSGNYRDMGERQTVGAPRKGERQTVGATRKGERQTVGATR